MKHIAWDFDGTIIDSFRVWTEAMAAHCHENGFALPNERELRSAFGNTQWLGFSVWNMPLEEQDRHRFLAYDRFYVIQKSRPDALRPIPGIIRMLRSLEKQGYVQSVVTS